MVDLGETASQTFGFNKFDIGLGTYGNIIALLFIGLVLLGCIGILIFLYFNAKRYKYRIPLYKKIGNIPTRIGVYKAREVPFGRAGDKLWFVKGRGLKKWLAPANIQTAKNEFWHFEREDGEWINFSMDDLDEVFKKAGAKYIQQDMRLQRLATEKLLEQRLGKKSFWDTWGTTIMTILFFLIIAVALVIFFYQYGKIVDKTGSILSQADGILRRVEKIENPNIPEDSLIPASLTLNLLKINTGV